MTCIIRCYQILEPIRSVTLGAKPLVSEAGHPVARNTVTRALHPLQMISLLSVVCPLRVTPFTPKAVGFALGLACQSHVAHLHHCTHEANGPFSSSIPVVESTVLKYILDLSVLYLSIYLLRDFPLLLHLISYKIYVLLLHYSHKTLLLH